VIITVTGYLDGLIIAVGSSGISASSCGSASGTAGGNGYLITIEGIVYTASTGGHGGTAGYSPGGGGGGYFGGYGSNGFGGNSAPGGSVTSTYNYLTRWSYVYTMLRFLGDEWQRYVLGKALSTYMGATYLAGYGAGGGGGAATNGDGAGGGGGGMGGQIVIYMHNLYVPTVGQIIAMGGTGGAATSAAAGGGGGGAGGLVYILTHNPVAFSGTIDVLGGIGLTGVSAPNVAGNPGGNGAPNTYAIFVV
jgi:hypothetical protein